MDGSTVVWTAGNVGDAVWVSDPELAWVAATVASFDEKKNVLCVTLASSHQSSAAKKNNNDSNNNAKSNTEIHLDSNGRVISSPKMERTETTRIPSTRDKVRAARKQFIALLLPRDTGHGAMENMDDLSYLHSASVLNNINLRFDQDLIYTRTGPILVAMNPFKWLPELFSPQQHHLYRISNYEDVPPHCFAEVEASFRQLVETREDQSLVICGESGAGKTETTRLMLGYLSGIHHTPSAATGEVSTKSETAHHSKSADAEYSHDHQELIARRIMQSNPLMEAFGNAKTVRNNNSSRFGKLICIQYSKDSNPHQQSDTTRERNRSSSSIGHHRRRSSTHDSTHVSRGLKLAGAKIMNYLLERSRTVHASTDERSFHVFYQLFSSASSETLRKQLKLQGLEPNSFKYLNQSGCVKVDGVDDALAFQETIEAMQAIGLSPQQTNDVWAVVAAVLHLGNVEFMSDPGSDEASKVRPSTDVWLTNSCALLQCDANVLRNALTTKRMNVPATSRSRTSSNHSTSIESPVNATQASEARDAVAKTMYFRLFSWLVARINDTTNASNTDLEGCVSILDIYGFEDLSSNQIGASTNGFSQLLINNANERLQSMFNHAVFEREARVYQDENIQWNPTDFPNNRACLDLIDARTKSIFALLDEECLRKAAGNDMAFCRKITALFGSHAYFGACGPTTPWRKLNGTRTTEQEFVIRHYADNVIYTCESFVAQNQDTFQTALASALASSNSVLVKELFAGDNQDNEVDSPSGNNNPKRSSLQTTIVSRFREQLCELAATIEASHPRFIRCIKSNKDLRPNVMDHKYSLLQLRNAGVIAALEMRRAGFPNRLMYRNFVLRYHVLAPKGIVEATRQDRATNEVLCGAVRDIIEGGRVRQVLSTDMYAFGLTKLFLRAEAQRVLDSLRAKVMYSSIVRVQAFLRQCRAEIEFGRMRDVAVWVQSVWRGVSARIKCAEMICAIQSRKQLQLLSASLSKMSARVEIVKTAALGPHEQEGTSTTNNIRNKPFQDALRLATTSLSKASQHLDLVQQQLGAPDETDVFKLKKQRDECNRTVDQLEGCWDRLLDERDKVGAAYRQLLDESRELEADVEDVHTWLLNPPWEDAVAKRRAFWRKHLSKEIDNVVVNTQNAATAFKTLITDIKEHSSDRVKQCQKQVNGVRELVQMAQSAKIVATDLLNNLKDEMQNLDDLWTAQKETLASIKTESQEHDLFQTLGTQLQTTLDRANVAIVRVGSEHVWQSDVKTTRRTLEDAQAVLDEAVKFTGSAVAHKLEVERQRCEAMKKLQSVELDMHSMRERVGELGMSSFAPIESFVNDFETCVAIIRPPPGKHGTVVFNDCNPEKAVERCVKVVESLRIYVENQVSLREKAEETRSLALAKFEPAVNAFEAAVNTAREVKLELAHGDIWQLVQDTEEKIQHLISLVEPNTNQPLCAATLSQTTQRVQEGTYAIETAQQQITTRVEQVARNNVVFEQLRNTLKDVSVSFGIVLGREQATHCVGTLLPVRERARSIRINAEKLFNEATRRVHSCCSRLTDEELSEARHAVEVASDIIGHGIEELGMLSVWEARWTENTDTCRGRVEESKAKVQTLKSLSNAAGSNSYKITSSTPSASQQAVQDAADLVKTAVNQLMELEKFSSLSKYENREAEKEENDEQQEGSDYESDEDIRIKSLWNRLQPRQTYPNTFGDRIQTDYSASVKTNYFTASKCFSRDVADKDMMSVQQTCVLLESAIGAAHAALDVDQSANHERVRLSREQSIRSNQRQTTAEREQREKQRARLGMRQAVANRVAPLREAANELRGFADAALIEAQMSIGFNTTYEQRPVHQNTTEEEEINPLHESALALQHRLAKLISIGLNIPDLSNDSDSVSLARMFDNLSTELAQCREDADHVGKLLESQRGSIKRQRELNDSLDETENALLCMVSPVVEKLIHGLELEQVNHVRSDVQQMAYCQAKERAMELLETAKRTIYDARAQIRCANLFNTIDDAPGKLAGAALAVESARDAVKTIYQAAGADLRELQDWVKETAAMKAAHVELEEARSELTWVRASHDQWIHHNNVGFDKGSERHTTSAVVALRCADTRLRELDSTFETGALHTKLGRTKWISDVRRFIAGVGVADQHVHAMKGSIKKQGREGERKKELKAWRVQVKKHIREKDSTREYVGRRNRNGSIGNSQSHGYSGVDRDTVAGSIRKSERSSHKNTTMEEENKLKKPSVAPKQVASTTDTSPATTKLLPSVSVSPVISTTSKSARVSSPRSNWRHINNHGGGKTTGIPKRPPSKVDDLFARVQRMRQELASD